MSKYFTEDEMRCKCGCGKCHMGPTFMQMLDAARGFAGIPFVVTSGYRCEKHDDEEAAQVHKAPSRNHTTGEAVDIDAKNGQDLMIILTALIQVGFRRIGVNLTSFWLHADKVPGKTTPCIWGY